MLQTRCAARHRRVARRPSPALGAAEALQPSPALGAAEPCPVCRLLPLCSIHADLGRNHPKAVISQVKLVSAAYPDGVKLRTVTDAGAVREPRASFKQRRSDLRASDLVQHWLKVRKRYRPGDGAGVRLAVNLLTQAKGYARDAAHDGADSNWHWKLSSKGAPGSDTLFESVSFGD